MPIGPITHPGSFALGSPESRAAARALAESHEASTYHCSTCVLSGLVVIDSELPDFIPSESMQKVSDGWAWKCPKHRDPRREGTVQALVKLGMLGGSLP